MDTNIIYNIDCVAGMNQMIDEASIDLIIADPPYFKVIGEKWDSQSYSTQTLYSLGQLPILMQ